MQMLPTSDCVCSGKQLGEVLGMNLRQIERHAQSGVLKPVRCKLRGKHFRLSESVQAYQRYREEIVKQQCSRTSDAYEKARSRRMAAEALCAELRAGELRGELLRADDVDRAVCSVLSIARSHLMAIPSRVTHSLLPHVAAETGNANFQAIHQIVTADVRRSLTEASQLEANGISRRRDRAKRNGEDGAA
jgi:phage terminase Nu1 subunit (DNA packaging protein)